MKIFVVNCGSSSIKCYLYQFEQKKEPSKPLWRAQVEWKNDFEALEVHVKTQTRYKKIQIPKIAIKAKKPLSELLLLVTDFLWQGDTAVISSLDDIDLIGHRIVHGGPYFQKSVRIDSDVKKKIQEISKLAPLHNAGELAAIEALEKIMKTIPQFAVFDTAFHHNLPQTAAIYPGPYRWYQENIKRYGFHGISFKYCHSAASKWVSPHCKMIICHLGSGASLAAIKDGISIDTTMGFTPLEGLMMDTRSGSLDPGILLHLLQKTPLEDITKELYYESGLLGISGVSSDMRDIIQMRGENERCALALEVYIHRLNKEIGGMIASLEGLDTLIFTAGIGENTPLIRSRVCKAFSFLGIEIDKEKNESVSEDSEISAERSTIKVLVIHTQEAFEIARECYNEIK